MCTQPLKMTPEILTFEENRHGWVVDHSVDKNFSDLVIEVEWN